MRAPLLLAFAILLASTSAQAQTTRSRVPGAVPPIMVEEGARAGTRATPSRKARRAETRASRRAKRRSRVVAPERVIVPLPSRRQSEIGSINRSLGEQGQIRAIQQQNQFELNQLRQQIQRNQFSPIGGTLGCPAGSIGC